LKGPFPKDIRKVTNIEKIVLEKNSISGTIPDTFNMSNLTVVNLGDNSLSGEIPASLFEGQIDHAIILRNNNFVGSVPDALCHTLTHFKVDDSTWFLDAPKIDCKCCDNIGCNLWEIIDTPVSGSARLCPQSNIFEAEFDSRYWIDDHIFKSDLHEFIGSDINQRKSFCLSPTGCYSLYSKTKTNLLFDLKYSATMDALEMQNKCDTVDICQISFSQDHPRRNGLNHLTQLIAPDLSNEDSPHYQVLCWILNNDILFDKYKICDGTLLQRYVMALFYHSQKQSFDSFENFAANDTCEWPGVVCDEKRRFVEQLHFQDKNFIGTLITEIGLLARLKVLDLGGNNLHGTLHSAIFSNMPYLEMFYVGKNEMKGQLPKELLDLPRLKNLNISHNKFTGTMPNANGFPDSLGKI